MTNYGVHLFGPFLRAVAVETGETCEECFFISAYPVQIVFKLIGIISLSEVLRKKFIYAIKILLVFEERKITISVLKHILDILEKLTVIPLMGFHCM